MEFLAILLLGCPLMAQIGSTGLVASESTNISATAAAGFLSPIPISGSGPVKMDGEIKGQQFYRWSVMAIMAGNVADTASSWHHAEANPILAGPGAAFSTRSAVLKAGFLGASLFIEHWALKHNPQLYRRLAWMNVAIAGGLGGVAMHNASLH